MGRCGAKEREATCITAHVMGQEAAAYLSRATVWQHLDGHDSGSHALRRHGASLASDPPTVLFVATMGLAQAIQNTRDSGSACHHAKVTLILAAVTPHPHGAEHREMLLLRCWPGSDVFTHNDRLPTTRFAQQSLLKTATRPVDGATTVREVVRTSWNPSRLARHEEG